MTSSACRKRELESLIESLPQDPWPHSVPLPSAEDLGLPAHAPARESKPIHALPQLPPRCASLYAPERFLGGGAYVGSPGTELEFAL